MASTKTIAEGRQRTRDKLELPKDYFPMDEVRVTKDQAKHIRRMFGRGLITMRTVRSRAEWREWPILRVPDLDIFIKTLGEYVEWQNQQPSVDRKTQSRINSRMRSFRALYRDLCDEDTRKKAEDAARKSIQRPFG